MTVLKLFRRGSRLEKSQKQARGATSAYSLTATILLSVAFPSQLL
jgi:hypothetical protein